MKEREVKANITSTDRLCPIIISGGVDDITCMEMRIEQNGISYTSTCKAKMLVVVVREVNECKILQLSDEEG